MYHQYYELKSYSMKRKKKTSQDINATKLEYSKARLCK